MSLAILALALMAACTDDQNNQETDSPQQTQQTSQPATASSGSGDSMAAATPSNAIAAREASAASMPSIHVVGTTNFVADWARVVGGDNVEVFGLLQPGADPHSFIPGTGDIAKVADADVVFTVGLGLEGDWIEGLLHNASADMSRIVALGDRVAPLEFGMGDMHDDHEDGDDHDEDEDDHQDEDEDDHDEDEDEHEDEHGHDHDHGSHDPHFWFDPLRVKIAVNEIAVRYSVLDPENAQTYIENAVAYGEQLDELHAWVQTQVATVEPERRLLVTSHDSLTYYAEAYGFEIVGLVIPSLATHVEPSAEHIADLVEVIREHEVPAVFGETTVSDRLAQAVVRETGAELVQLYSGSLGPEGSGAETYLGMVRANTESIIEALR